MIYFLPKVMFNCLIITIILEVFTALIFKVRSTKDLLNIVLINIVTNPVLVVITYYVNIYYSMKVYYIVLIILELCVVFIEGFVYKKYLKFKNINPFVLAFILNCSSYFIGRIINNIIY